MNQAKAGTKCSFFKQPSVKHRSWNGRRPQPTMSTEERKHKHTCTVVS